MDKAHATSARTGIISRAHGIAARTGTISIVRLIAVLTAVIFMSGVIGCGQSSQNDELSSSESAAADSQTVEDYRDAERIISMGCSGNGPNSDFFREIWEKSGHSIYVNFYSNGAFGNDEELLKSVQEGTLDVYYGATSGATSLVPELSLLDIPYEFEDLDTANELLSGPLFDWFQQYYQAQGFQLLAWGACDFRELTTNVEITGPEDFSKLKIRVLDNPFHRSYWSAVGAKPSVMDFSEVFYALQQGEINSQENPVSVAINSNLYEVQKYLVMTEHLPFVYTRVMNLDLYNSLTAEQQQMLVEYLQEDLDKYVTTPEDSIEKAKENTDMEVIIPDAETMDYLKSKNQVVIDALKEKLGDDLVDEYLSMIP